MNWWHKLVRREAEPQGDRTDYMTERIERARAERDESAAQLAEVRELTARNRRHLAANHFGERMTAAFEARRRHA